MAVVAQDDALTLDDLEVLIMLSQHTSYINVEACPYPLTRTLIIQQSLSAWNNRTADKAANHCPSRRIESAPPGTERTGCASTQTVGPLATPGMFSEADGLPRPKPERLAETVALPKKSAFSPRNGSRGIFLHRHAKVEIKEIMSTGIRDEDPLTLDDLEALILLNDELSEEVRQAYLRLIEKLRAQLTTRKDLNGET